MTIFAFWQTVGGPTITGPEIMLGLAVLGFIYGVFKIGSMWGKTRKEVDGIEGLRVEVHDGFARVDAALTRFGEGLTALSSALAALTVMVNQHEKMLNRPDDS